MSTQTESRRAGISYNRAELYNEYYVEEKPIGEIADEKSVSHNTISRLLDDLNIPKKTRVRIEREKRERHREDKEYTKKEKLKKLYQRDGKSTRQIAEMFGVTASCIRYHLDKHGIKTRKQSYDIPAFNLSSKAPYRGYPCWKGCDGKQIPVHKLVAISNGANPHVVFGDADYDIHHKNGHKVDNTPENLEVIHKQEHGKIHQQRQRGYSKREMKSAIYHVLFGVQNR